MKSEKVKSNVAKGNEYEKVAKQILLKKEIVWNRNVSFDSESNEKKIEGISGVKHQIDIHLVSSLNPSCHLLVECKGHEKSVEKSLACSFITIIKDIEKKRKDWDIIPVFASNNGFDPGAKNMLKYYKIAYLDLKNVSNKIYRMSISEQSIFNKVEITNVILEDGSRAEKFEGFRNDIKGDVFRAENIIGSYELFDDKNKNIRDVLNYVGYFKTGKRKNKECHDDEYVGICSGKKLSYIEGYFKGKTVSKASTSETKIASDTIAVFYRSKTEYFVFRKNGSIERYKLNRTKKFFSRV